MRFEIEFFDGTKVVKEADHGDLAKAAAKRERRLALPRDTPASAAEVKVKRVTKID